MSDADGRAAELPPWRRARRAAYHALARGLLDLARVSPPPVLSGACRGLARVALRARGDERERALANLRRVFPDWSEARRVKLLGEAADLMGRNLADALTLPEAAASGFADVRDDGAGDALEALLAEGRGLLILTGHFGCWELLGAWLARRLGGLAVVTGTVHNAPVAGLLQRRRAELGMTPLPREGDLRPLVRRLREGRAVAVLLDQNTRVPNVAVPFCGPPAPTPLGFAKLALRYRPPVAPLAVARDGRGHRIVRLETIRPDEPDDVEGRIRFLARCNAALEEILRRNPAEWVWFHRRWEDGDDGGAPAPEATTTEGRG